MKDNETADVLGSLSYAKLLVFAMGHLISYLRYAIRKINHENYEKKTRA